VAGETLLYTASPTLAGAAGGKLFGSVFGRSGGQFNKLPGRVGPWGLAHYAPSGGTRLGTAAAVFVAGAGPGGVVGAYQGATQAAANGDSPWLGGLLGGLEGTVKGGVTALATAGIAYGGVKLYNAASRGAPAPTSTADDIVLGGRHRDTKIDGKRHGTESHHLIADEVSNVATDDALAIRMQRDDHVYRTASWGSRNSSKRFRADQRRLVEQERYDEALRMGIDDVNAQNPGVYEKHIQQALDSAPRKPDGSINWSAFKPKK
jgi:hypothetical protein